jgi:hypothetical protein
MSRDFDLRRISAASTPARGIVADEGVTFPHYASPRNSAMTIGDSVAALRGIHDNRCNGSL